MKTHQTLKLAAAVAAACFACDAYAVPGAITGVSAQPVEGTVGESVYFKVTGTGDLCGFRLYYNNNMNVYEPADNSTINGTKVSGSQPGTPGGINKTFQKAGTYQIQATGSNSAYNYACTGTRQITFVVKEKAAPPKPIGGMTTGTVATTTPNLGLMPVGQCPADPWHKIVQNSNDETGKLRCIRTNPSCPAGWKKLAYNDQTGAITCVPEVAGACPMGWKGGMNASTGVLACEPDPTPVIACAKSTPKNQWGTTYYKESWNILGCSENLAPPK